MTNTLPSKQTLITLFEKASNHIEKARDAVRHSVNTAMVRAYWYIGKEIVEEEQLGQAKAEYGTYLLKNLSMQLNKHYGKGFGISTVRDIRQFYLSYPAPSIHHALRGESLPFSNNLGWIHFRALMRIERPEARQFYCNSPH